MSQRLFQSPISRSNFIKGLSLGGLSLGLSSCLPDGGTEQQIQTPTSAYNPPRPSKYIPIPPVWKEPIISGTQYKDAYSNSEIRLKIFEKNPSIWQNLSDEVYTVVNYSWLESMSEWMWNVEKVTGVKYSLNAFDCEDYTLLFYVGCTMSASMAGKKITPAVVRIVIKRSDGLRHEDRKSVV